MRQAALQTCSRACHRMRASSTLCSPIQNHRYSPGHLTAKARYFRVTRAGQISSPWRLPSFLNCREGCCGSFFSKANPTDLPRCHSRESGNPGRNVYRQADRDNRSRNPRSRLSTGGCASGVYRSIGSGGSLSRPAKPSACSNAGGGKSVSARLNPKPE